MSFMRSEKIFMSFKIKRFFFLFFIGYAMVLNSCNKSDKILEKPFVEFIVDSGCIYKDTILPMGTIMKFKIKATGLNVPITNLVVSFNNGTEQVFLDTGIYSKEFYYDVEIIKGTSASEQWTFMVMNKDREMVSVNAVIGIDTGAVFGDIKDYNIALGAQDNTQTGQFYSFTTEQVSTLEEAFNNQQTIDIGYYYHSVYESTLSSPNDNDASTIFTGTNGISNWQIRNEARYNLTTLSATDFDNTLNDSLLIASYDVTNAKRKGKNIVVGQVWAFRIQSGKIGLMKIDSIVPNTNGQVDLSIKIQE